WPGKDANIHSGLWQNFVMLRMVKQTQRRAIGARRKKTTGPGHPGGGHSTRLLRKSLSGIKEAASFALKTWRPVFQVESKVKMTSPATSGNQPPWAIFKRLAPAKASSIIRKGTQTSAALHKLQCHNR